MNRRTHWTLLLILALGVSLSGCEVPASIKNRVIRKAMVAIRAPFSNSPQQVGLEDQELQTEYEVIGVEPSWLADFNACDQNDYYLNLLSSLVVGEYDINPRNGEPRHFEDLKYVIDTTLINCVREKRPEITVLLHATMYGDFETHGGSLRRNNYRSFLEASPKGQMARQNFQENIGLYIGQRKWFDGVVIDFPYLPRGQEEELVAFLRTLRRKIDQVTVNDVVKKRLYLKIPAFDKNNLVYADVVSRYLKPVPNESQVVVDQYIITAYAPEYEAHLSPSWPLHAMEEGTYNLDSMALFFDRIGLQPVFEFPYLGYERENRVWHPKSYAAIASNLESEEVVFQHEPPDFEYAKASEGQRKWVFEDSLSLSVKYDWIKERKMGGVALYGLGYGKGRKELWQALGGGFGKPTTALLYPGIAFLLMFFGIGIGFANVRYWEVRNTLARPGNRMLFVYFLLGLFLIGTLTVWGFLWNNNLFKPTTSTWMAGGAVLLILCFPVGRKLLGTVRRYF